MSLCRLVRLLVYLFTRASIAFFGMPPPPSRKCEEAYLSIHRTCGGLPQNVRCSRSIDVDTLLVANCYSGQSANEIFGRNFTIPRRLNVHSDKYTDVGSPCALRNPFPQSTDHIFAFRPTSNLDHGQSSTQ